VSRSSSTCVGCSTLPSNGWRGGRIRCATHSSSKESYGSPYMFNS
jgi:hypothetical protein